MRNCFYVDGILGSTSSFSSHQYPSPENPPCPRGGNKETDSEWKFSAQRLLMIPIDLSTSLVTLVHLGVFCC